MKPRIAIHWFRRDLRLSDNTALIAACRDFDAVLPVFVFDPRLLHRDDVGGPRIAFLLESLDALERSLAERGVPLIVRTGDPAEVLTTLAQKTRAEAVFVNRDYSPYARRRDRAVESRLRAGGVRWFEHADLLLTEPWECLKSDGTPYTVFTPFSRRWREVAKCEPERRPRLPKAEIPRAHRVSAGERPSLADLGFRLEASIPKGGESSAQRRLRRFRALRLARYATDRDLPAINGTSGLSADLKFGTISPRQVFAAATSFVGADHIAADPRRPPPGLSHDDAQRLTNGGTFVSELCWRDFYYAILFHFPRVAREAFRQDYVDLQWPETRPALRDAWVEGRTGFPIIDAGMRQLARTGWMHNRLRMLTACFLTKTLLVDWRFGEKVFQQRLVDADLAANNGGWQWCASTGTDAQPYFRIFNPTTQSKRFDPDGEYIRRWVPELSQVPAPLVHEPWRDPSVLARTGYPEPCVDYASKRKEALDLLGPSASRPKASAASRSV